ncbi:MAG: hypothetical protein IKY39_02940 [Clostridia bacterium]|nr:hypothetical protein [Clostridia bacterium]
MKMIKDKKLLLKILSGFIAVVLWFAITYTEDPAVSQHVTNVGAVFSGEALLRERGLTVVNKDELPAFSATIRGNRSKVISSLGVISAHIDVSNIYNVGTHEVLVQYSYPRDMVTLTKTKVSSVPINVEKILSRDIPVKLEAEVSGRDNGQLVAIKSKSETLTVRGAQSVVEKIAYAKAIIDTSEITANGDMNYSYKLYDNDGNVLNERNIISKSENTVLVTGTIYKKVELPVKVELADSLKANYTLKVKKQSVSALTVGIPDNVTETQLYAVLDSNATREHSPATLEIQVPDGIYCPSEDLSVTVEYELLPRIMHDVEVQVSAENIPEGREVQLTPEKIKVAVKCAKNDAVASKISATINAEDLSETDKSVNVTVSAEENIDVVGEYTVNARLL